MAQPEVLLNANNIAGIELLGNDSIPANLVQGLRENSAASMLPYVVVVRNTGSLPITGLDVRYELNTRGDEVVKNFFYGSPGDMADPASIPVIAPGKSAVISPDHLVNERIMSWVVSPLPDQHAAAIARKVAGFNKADKIAISVDSVIRSNGVIVGPDRSSRFRLFQQEIWGYTEFRNELLKRFSEGDSDADIISWLKQTASLRVIRSVKNEPLDRGVITQKTLAEQYLALVEKGQRQYCWDELKASPTEVRLRRIFKVRQELQP